MSPERTKAAKMLRDETLATLITTETVERWAVARATDDEGDA
jgi:hypothetical protein